MHSLTIPVIISVPTDINFMETSAVGTKGSITVSI